MRATTPICSEWHISLCAEVRRGQAYVLTEGRERGNGRQTSNASEESVGQQSSLHSAREVGALDGKGTGLSGGRDVSDGLGDDDKVGGDEGKYQVATNREGEASRPKESGSGSRSDGGAVEVTASCSEIGSAGDSES